MTQRFLLGWSNNIPADAVTSALKRFSHQHVVHHHFVLVSINLCVVHYVITLLAKLAYVYMYTTKTTL